MKTAVDARFREESKRFALRFACQDCAHFEEVSERCGNGYPNAAHRAHRLESLSELEFCKQFELA